MNGRSESTYKHKRRVSPLERKSGGQLVAFVVAFVLLATVALTYVGSFLWAVLAGLKTHDELVMKPFALPGAWQFSNYLDAFVMLEVRGVSMLGMIGNSVWLAIGGASLGVLGPTLMAYAVTKFKFVGRNILITVNVIVMIVPIVGALPSQYRLYFATGLVNSPFIVITHFGCFGSLNLIMCAVFRNLSDEFRDAFRIDGAGEYTILFKLILPLVSAPMLALFIMQVVGVWNDYMTALLFLPLRPTLATGIYLFGQQMTYRARKDILMSATVVSAIPPLILYMLFSRTILTNITLGGIKG